MKRILSILSLVAIFSLISPVWAAPSSHISNPSSGKEIHSGHKAHQKNKPAAGLRTPLPPPKHNGSSVIISSVPAGCNCRNYHHCNYRVGLHKHCLASCLDSDMHLNVNIRF